MPCYEEEAASLGDGRGLVRGRLREEREREEKIILSEHVQNKKREGVPCYEEEAASLEEEIEEDW